MPDKYPTCETESNEVEIVTVSMTHPCPDFPNVTFDSYDSILGFDIVVIDLDAATEEFPTCNAAGNWALDEEDSERWWDAIDRRRSEFQEILATGATVVALNAENLYIDVFPRREEKANDEDANGSEAKRAQTTISNIFKIDLSFDKALGHNLECCGDGPFKTFASRMAGRLAFRGILTTRAAFPLFKIQRSKKNVSALFQSGSGSIIVLPRPKHPKEDTCEFLNAVRDLVTALQIAPETPGTPVEPAYAHNYRSSSELQYLNKLNKLIAQRDDLSSKISEIEDALGAEFRLKRLFFSSGTPLEDAVREALTELGFSVQSGPPGRADLIAEYNGRIAVIEIKGVTKSAAESHAAQLEKWSSDYLIDNQTEAKPILIVNAWINEEPLDRKEDPFPPQMVSYCERRNHCLLTGLQLYCAVVDCRKSRTRAEAFVEEVFATEGVLNKYMDAAAFIQAVNTTDS